VFSWHRDMPSAPNIVHHGERPFAETLPWIRHADVGLALYRYRDGAEHLADSSLKIIQYTWCRLPVVAPNFAAAPENPHVIGYAPGDAASIKAACVRALAVDRAAIDVSRICDWDALVRHLAG
jgi:2-beta-glucuronyltransferase